MNKRYVKINIWRWMAGCIGLMLLGSTLFFCLSHIVPADPVNAREIETSSEYFDFNKTTGTITGYDDVNGPSDIVFPEKIDGITVRAIGDRAFIHKDITSLIFPGSIKTIGAHAFSFCDVQFVHFSEGIERIGAFSFYFNNITTIVLPDSLLTIEAYAFCYNEMESIYFGSGLTHIGDWAFNSNYIQRLYLPETVTDIGKGAFCANEIVYVDLPSKIQSIEEFAFHNNSLATIVFPDTIERIGIDAFSSNNLQSVVLPNRLELIEENAFCFNRLTIVTIPSRVTTIGPYAFSENQLESVVLSEGLEVIDYAAFSGNRIIEVNIPSTVNEIAEAAFISNQIEQLILPEGLKTIGDDAFYGNQLTELVIPSTVTTIGSSAFSSNQLEQLLLPENLQSVGERAFAKNNLSQITIHAPAVELGDELLFSWSWRTDDEKYVNHFRELYEEKGPGEYIGSQEGSWQFVAPHAIILEDPVGGTAVVSVDKNPAMTGEQVIITIDQIEPGVKLSRILFNEERGTYETLMEGRQYAFEMPGEELTITVQFSPKPYTLRFDSDGGSPIDSKKIYYGAPIKVVDIPEREGYTFEGWTPALPQTMPPKDLLVTATWSKKVYTVYFETNGGSAVESQQVVYEDLINLPPVPEQKGFLFKGWYLDDTYERPWDFSTDTMPTEDITLYAKWSSTEIVAVGIGFCIAIGIVLISASVLFFGIVFSVRKKAKKGK